MAKEKLKIVPNYGYIKFKSNAIVSNKSILERAILFNGVAPNKAYSGLKTREKVGKKKSVQK